MDMKALGYNVSFMPSNMYYDTEYAEQLKKKGIEVVTSCDGCYTPNDFIAQHGAEFGLFYLIRFDCCRRNSLNYTAGCSEIQRLFPCPGRLLPARIT